MEEGFGGVTPEKIFRIYMQNGDIWWILRLIHKDFGKVFSYHLRSYYIYFRLSIFLIARSVAGSVCQIVNFFNAEQWWDINKDTTSS